MIHYYYLSIIYAFTKNTDRYLMVKFDSDYAILGTLAAEIIEGIPLRESVVSCTNDACRKLYGKLQG